MNNYQVEFVQTAIANQALQFGQFTLKSGRISPYFFNMAAFHTGEAMAKLGQAYAKTIQSYQLPFDVIFGPAYKGIPLAITTAIALANDHHQNVAYCFNRKETKHHGEGGILVGSSLENKKILIIDDVITQGTAIQESIQIIKQAGGICSGIIIALDRQEIIETTGLSAIETIEKHHQIPVHAIITLQDILQFTAHDQAYQKYEQAISTYQQQYGVCSNILASSI